MRTQVPERILRLAAACLAGSRRASAAGVEEPQVLQAASRTLVSRMAQRLKPGEAYALCTLALTLAKAEHPRLEPIRAAADGTLMGLAAALDGLPENQQHDLAVIILGHDLRLLGTLISEEELNRLLAELWPDALV
jgi:hypothetical protein